MSRAIVAAVIFVFMVSPMANGATPLTIEGTSFVLRQDNQVLRSTDLIGAEIDLGNGQTVRIDAVRIDPDDPDVLLHRFSVKDVASDAWVNPCSPDADGNQEGFPLLGRWADHDASYHADENYFALTCATGAQAKCIRFGYKPWQKRPDGDSMQPLYEACMRMVRADYCGDNQPATETGMLIDVYDASGINAPESGPDFHFEAGWSPTGAVCVHHTRVQDNLSLEALIKRCPRLAATAGEACTEESARQAGAVLFNKSK